VSLLTELDAFFTEQGRCGDLDAGVDGVVIWFGLRVRSCGSPGVLTTATYLTSTVESPHHPGMDRRRFLLTSLAGVLAAPLAVEAQQVAKVPRIGVVAPAGLHDPDVAGFQQGLRELGYVKGQNLLVEYRAAEGKPERFPDLFGEILHLKVDVIVTGSLPAALAVKKSTSTTPVVVAASGDPVGAGVVASLARPGANITGLSLASEETFGEKWVELLKEIVPRLSRVTVLAASTGPGVEIELKAIRNAGRALGVKIQSLRWRSPSQLEGLFAVILAEHR
jgi:putative tryptophan/tyrosine transport system substrate-binding protein